jgi:hypothetical protein
VTDINRCSVMCTETFGLEDALLLLLLLLLLLERL